MKQALPVNNQNLFIYGLMAFPFAMAGIPLYMHAPDLYSKNHGLSLNIIGASLLVLRLVDAFIDPIIGYYTDKYFKYKKAIFICGIILLAFGFYFLFNPLPEYNLAVWFFCSVFIASFGFSLVTINLSAFGATWSDDYNLKTKISSFREASGLLGLIFAVVAPSVFAYFQLQNIFQIYSLIMVFILLLCTVIFTKYWLNKTNFTNNVLSDFNFKKSILALSVKRKFFSVYFLSILASSLPAVLVLFFIRDKLKLEQYTGLFLGAYFVSAAASMVFWNFISKRIGKGKSWFLSALIAILSFIWAFYLPAGSLLAYLVICIVSGVAFGGELAIPPAILADKTSINSSTLDYSVLAFLSKSSLAIATGFSYIILSYFNFKTAEQNPEAAMLALNFLYAFIPCVLKILSMFFMYKFLIKGEKNESNNIINNGSFYG